MLESYCTFVKFTNENHMITIFDVIGQSQTNQIFKIHILPIDCKYSWSFPITVDQIQLLSHHENS